MVKVRSLLSRALALVLVLALLMCGVVSAGATEEDSLANQPTGENLFPDPGFESVTEDWLLLTETAPSYSSSVSHGGSQSMQIPAGNGIKLMNRIDIELGVTYEITAWVYGKIHLIAMMHDPAGNKVDYYNAAMPFMEGGEEGKWTQITGTFMTQDDRIGSVSIEFRAAPNDGYVDDISFRSCGVIEDTWQPTPSEEPVKLGCYYFGQWTNPEMWSKIAYFEDVDIEPIAGYYNNNLVEVMEWHTKQASDHGISYWVFDWYYDVGRASVQCPSLDDAFLKSSNCKDMEFALLWCNEESDTSGWTEENLLKMAQLICDKYLTQDNYLKTADGQNYFSLTRPDRLIEKFGLQGTKAILKKMDEIAAPYGGFYYVAINNPTESVAKQMQAVGIEALTLYSYNNQGIAQGEEEGPYENILPIVEPIIRQGAKDDILPIIPCVSPNWDSRPWTGMGGRGTWRSGSTPELFAKMCATLRPYADAELNMMMVGTWNEFGEGSYIEPTTLYGCSYLDALQKTLLPDTYEEHEVAVPTDEQKAAMIFTDIPPVEIEREDETNLVVNPGFERGYGWVTIENYELQYSSDDVQEGDQSIIITKQQKGVKSTSLVALEPGKVYNLSVWVKGNGYMTCGIYDENQVWNGEYLEFEEENPQSLVYDEWVRLWGTIDNTDGKYKYVDFTIVNDSEDDSVLLVDKVEFREDGVEPPAEQTEPAVEDETEATEPSDTTDETPAANNSNSIVIIICVAAVVVVAVVFFLLGRKKGKKE